MGPCGGNCVRVKLPGIDSSQDSPERLSDRERKGGEDSIGTSSWEGDWLREKSLWGHFRKTNDGNLHSLTQNDLLKRHKKRSKAKEKQENEKRGEGWKKNTGQNLPANGRRKKKNCWVTPTRIYSVGFFSTFNNVPFQITHPHVRSRTKRVWYYQIWMNEIDETQKNKGCKVQELLEGIIRIFWGGVVWVTRIQSIYSRGLLAWSSLEEQKNQKRSWAMCCFGKRQQHIYFPPKNQYEFRCQLYIDYLDLFTLPEDSYCVTMVYEKFSLDSPKSHTNSNSWQR